MNLNPKIIYQKFLYNYYKEHIHDNLWQNKYDKDVGKINFQIINLKNEMNDLEDVESQEIKRYKKSRGKHRKHLMFLSDIRKNVFYSKQDELNQLKNLQKLVQINKTKQFFYKNYDDYFSKHIKQYIFLQKIKLDLKNKYEKTINSYYKHIYHTISISNLLRFKDLDEVDNLLYKKITSIMHNEF
jgi:hypothetical protein